jgi:hypothetical protein
MVALTGYKSGGEGLEPPRATARPSAGPPPETEPIIRPFTELPREAARNVLSTGRPPYHQPSHRYIDERFARRGDFRNGKMRLQAGPFGIGKIGRVRLSHAY